jgi:nucleoside-diphosphate-sugar epimerase
LSSLALVTGGGGFIGSHLVDALLSRGDHVRVVDDWSNGRRENLPAADPRLEILTADIRDEDAMAHAARGCATIYHQAALGSVPRSLVDPLSTHDINVDGTFSVFLAARKAAVPRVVYASSSSVYGDDPELPKVERRLGNPLSPYAATKRANEIEAAGMARACGAVFVGLRYFNVYGPRQRADSPYAAVIPLFFRAALDGTRPRIHGDGTQSRDFTFVGDAVSANLLAADAAFESVEAPVFNVSRGERVTINELWRILAGLLGTSVAPEHGPPRPGDVLHSLADISEARRRLGFSPAVSLSEGLAASADFYRSELGTSRPAR